MIHEYAKTGALLTFYNSTDATMSHVIRFNCGAWVIPYVVEKVSREIRKVSDLNEKDHLNPHLATYLTIAELVRFPCDMVNFHLAPRGKSAYQLYIEEGVFTAGRENPYQNNYGFVGVDVANFIPASARHNTFKAGWTFEQIQNRLYHAIAWSRGAILYTGFDYRDIEHEIFNRQSFSKVFLDTLKDRPLRAPSFTEPEQVSPVILNLDYRTFCEASRRIALMRLNTGLHTIDNPHTYLMRREADNVVLPFSTHEGLKSSTGWTVEELERFNYAVSAYHRNAE